MQMRVSPLRLVRSEFRRRLLWVHDIQLFDGCLQTVGSDDPCWTLRCNSLMRGRTEPCFYFFPFSYAWISFPFFFNTGRVHPKPSFGCGFDRNVTLMKLLSHPLGKAYFDSLEFQWTDGIDSLYVAFSVGASVPLTLILRSTTPYLCCGGALSSKFIQRVIWWLADKHEIVLEVANRSTHKSAHSKGGGTVNFACSRCLLSLCSGNACDQMLQDVSQNLSAVLCMRHGLFGTEPGAVRIYGGLSWWSLPSETHWDGPFL